jgi:hypothetical protein
VIFSPKKKGICDRLLFFQKKKFGRNGKFFPPKRKSLEITIWIYIFPTIYENRYLNEFSLTDFPPSEKDHICIRFPTGMRIVSKIAIVWQDRMYLTVCTCSSTSTSLGSWTGGFFFLGVFVCSQNGSIILRKKMWEKRKEKVAITPNP